MKRYFEDEEENKENLINDIKTTLNKNEENSDDDSFNYLEDLSQDDLLNLYSQVKSLNKTEEETYNDSSSNDNYSTLEELMNINVDDYIEKRLKKIKNLFDNFDRDNATYDINLDLIDLSQSNRTNKDEGIQGITIKFLWTFSKERKFNKGSIIKTEITQEDSFFYKTFRDYKDFLDISLMDFLYFIRINRDIEDCVNGVIETINEYSLDKI